MQVNRLMTWSARLLTVVLTAASCAQMGRSDNRGTVYGPAPSPAPIAGELVGEIDRVDPNTRQIVARTSDGRFQTVSFDERTQVMYRGQVYPVTALERGDMVSMRFGSGGQGYVDSISVQQSVQERRGATGPAGSVGPASPTGPAGPGAGTLPRQRIEGTVGMIDAQRGLFEVRTSDLGTLTVSLPYNPRGTDMERFQRLRSGDTVRLTGRLLNAQRFELEQFL
jgi:hypothetical protein